MILQTLLRELIRFYCHVSPLDRGKFRLALWAYQHLSPPRAPVRTRLGKHFHVELDPSEFVQSQIYYIGYYELFLARFFCKLVTPGVTLADIGAHIGQYTLLAAHRGALVHAFEPNPKNFEQLQHNLRLNHLSQVVVNSAAVADHVGTNTFYLPDESNTGSGSLQPALLASKRTTIVTTTTLDRYFEQVGAGPQLIKMDIEGGELPALRGALGVLHASRPILLLEASEVSSRAFGYSPKDLIAFVSDLNYRCYTLDRTKLRPVQIGAQLCYENLICVHADSPLRMGS
jgi:FkbM family methyltransferase